jgi:hypothetical protein
MDARKLTSIARCATVCASLTCAGAVQAAGTFDGDWNVKLTCPEAAGNTRGYTYQFPAEIQENVLHGEHGAQQTSGWLTLDGKIEPDGSATLVAQGLANSGGRADGKAPYSYEVNAQFDATSGSGTRTTARQCNFVFVKE